MEHLLRSKALPFLVSFTVACIFSALNEKDEEKKQEKKLSDLRMKVSNNKKFIKHKINSDTLELF